MDLEKKTKETTCAHQHTGPYTFVVEPSKKAWEEIVAALTEGRKDYLVGLLKSYPEFFNPFNTRNGCSSLDLPCFTGGCLIGSE